MEQIDINNDSIYIIDLINNLQNIDSNFLLNVTSNSDSGKILFQNKKITHVKTNSNKSGKIAFDEILSWNDYSEKKLSLGVNKNTDNLKFELFLLDNTQSLFEKFEEKIDIKFQDIGSSFSKKHDDIVSIFILDFSKKEILLKIINDETYSSEIFSLYLDYIINFIKKKKALEPKKFKTDDMEKNNDSENEIYSISPFLCVCKPLNENIYISMILKPSTSLVFALKYIRELFLGIIKVELK